MDVLSSFFCFFKQKTAYEIPKRDWSSDVCSSDLEWLLSSICRSLMSPSLTRYTRIELGSLTTRPPLHQMPQVGSAGSPLLGLATITRTLGVPGSSDWTATFFWKLTPWPTSQMAVPRTLSVMSWPA